MNLSHNSNCLTVNTPAKVNWYLELLRKRSDGFHQIETVMSTVSLYDTMSFTLRVDDRFKLSIRDHRPNPTDSIPLGDENLILKAAKLLWDSYPNVTERTGVDIVLHKRIPSAAGLGGASSNAAVTLNTMNDLWGSNLDRDRLHGLAAQLGSDVPFFLDGGAALCEGRGEIISAVNAPSGKWVVIGKPTAGLSTPEVFSRVELGDDLGDAAEFADCLIDGRASVIGRQMHNRLQQFAMPMHREIEALQDEFQLLQDAGRCCGHQLSGSGSSYFGLFRSRRLARNAAQRLRGRLRDAAFYCCQTIGSYGLGNSDQRTMAS